MNEPEDHVVEYALAEAFDAPRGDLAERVLAKVRADEREASSPLRPLVWVAAAAAVVVTTLWSLGDGEESRDRVVAAIPDGPVEVALPNGTTRESRDRVRLGDTVVVGPERERTFTFDGSDTVVADPCSMWTLERTPDGAEIALHMGSVVVARASDLELDVTSRLGTVALGPNTTVRVDALVDGYDLSNPTGFSSLATDIHMNAFTPAIATTITLLAGTALLEGPSGAQELAAGEPVQSEEHVAPVADIHAKLQEEVGSWTISVVNYRPDGTALDPIEGVEECRRGPGGKWLITDLTIEFRGRTIQTNTVLGYDPLAKEYAGSFVDSFGGEVGLLRGKPTEGLGERHVVMYSAKGTPGFDSRWHMTWESKDRRRTRIERLDGDDWVLIREIVAERRSKDRR